MLAKGQKMVSESRTYVAQCLKSDFSGYYFKKFTLPQGMDNTAEFASWYFLNRLNAFACIEGVMPVEDYETCTEQT
jgi:hypothetical protein